MLFPDNGNRQNGAERDNNIPARRKKNTLTLRQWRRDTFRKQSEPLLPDIFRAFCTSFLFTWVLSLSSVCEVGVHTWEILLLLWIAELVCITDENGCNWVYNCVMPIHQITLIMPTNVYHVRVYVNLNLTLALCDPPFVLLSAISMSILFQECVNGRVLPDIYSTCPAAPRGEFWMQYLTLLILPVFPKFLHKNNLIPDWSCAQVICF